MTVEVQIATRAKGVPARGEIVAWAEAALGEPAVGGAGELTVRVVGKPEGTRLNRDYRGMDRPTNVLSFPFDDQPGPEGERLGLLGDVVICAPVVSAEASQQGKTLSAHYAHLVIHGVLHLRGFDHQDEAEAAAMETLESTLVTGLGFPDPYQSPGPHGEVDAS